MTNPIDIMLHPMAEEGGVGVGEVIDVGNDRTIAELLIHISAFTGGMLELWIETSFTGVDSWFEVGHVSKTSVVTGEELFAIKCERFMRARWAITGGPPTSGYTATFQVAGQMHQTYVDYYDLKQAMPENLFVGFPPGILARAAIQATDEAAGYLDDFFGLPLVSWNHALRLYVGKMAFWHVMARRGYNPEVVPDNTIRQGWLDAIAWLQGGAAGAGIVDSTPGVEGSESGGYVVSGPERGWLPPM